MTVYDARLHLASTVRGAVFWLCVSVAMMGVLLWLRHAAWPVSIAAISSQIVLSGTILWHLRKFGSNGPAETLLFRFAVVLPFVLFSLMSLAVPR